MCSGMFFILKLCLNAVKWSVLFGKGLILFSWLLLVLNGVSVLMMCVAAVMLGVGVELQ